MCVEFDLNAQVTAESNHYIIDNAAKTSREKTFLKSCIRGSAWNFPSTNRQRIADCEKILETYRENKEFFEAKEE